MLFHGIYSIRRFSTLTSYFPFYWWSLRGYDSASTVCVCGLLLAGFIGVLIPLLAPVCLSTWISDPSPQPFDKHHLATLHKLIFWKVFMTNEKLDVKIFILSQVVSLLLVPCSPVLPASWSGGR